MAEPAMSTDMSTGLAYPKGRTRKQVKARKDRAEAAVKRAVRAACVKRDGYCRAATIWHDKFDDPLYWLECQSESQWAHLHTHRRSQTRGQAADKRHTTAGSLCLCRYHHREYDAHRLIIEPLTKKGCDGPLRFQRAQ
jgi:hypothetical protein